MNEPIKTYATHFCGVGGACWGLEQAGLECRLAIDYLDYAVEYRKKNLGHQALCMDISEYIPDKAHAADVLWTSPPCQTFSTAAREKSVANKDDIRNNLFLASAKYVKEFRPQFVVLENVSGLLSHSADGQGDGTLTEMRRTFDSLGYNVEFNTLNSVFFGLPQERERLFIFASREGREGLCPEEPIKRDEKNKVIKPTFRPVMERHSLKEAWNGETYKTALHKVFRLAEKNGEFRITIIGPDDILPTMTCGWGGGATRKKVAILDETEGVHGVAFLRHPTVREGARAQGFPESWVFPESTTKAWTLIGNAVSSPVSKAIAEHFKLIALGEVPPYKKEISGKRIPEYVKSLAYDIPIVAPWVEESEE